MNIKASYQYQIRQNYRPSIVFFAVYCGFLLTMMILTKVFAPGDSTLSGCDFVAAIFLLVMALNAFKENFGMSIQNAISRKTLFSARMLTMVSLAVGVALVERIINFFLGFVARWSGMEMISGYEQLFDERAERSGDAVYFLESLLFEIGLFLAMIAIGYFITILYYRMNKMLKIIVSVVVPFLFMFGPVIDAELTGGKVVNFLTENFIRATGVTEQNPYIFLLSSVICAAVFSALSFLLMRRAVVKDA